MTCYWPYTGSIYPEKGASASPGTRLLSGLRAAGERWIGRDGHDPARIIQLVASGAVDVNGFITAKYPLTDAAAAFEEYERNPSRILRIVIDSQG